MPILSVVEALTLFVAVLILAFWYLRYVFWQQKVEERKRDERLAQVRQDRYERLEASARRRAAEQQVKRESSPKVVPAGQVVRHPAAPPASSGSSSFSPSSSPLHNPLSLNNPTSPLYAGSDSRDDCKPSRDSYDCSPSPSSTDSGGSSSWSD